MLLSNPPDNKHAIGRSVVSTLFFTALQNVLCIVFIASFTSSEPYEMVLFKLNELYDFENSI